MEKMKKFEVGKCYYTRSICDYDCVFIYKIIKRTEKNVYLQEEDTSEGTKKRKIYIDERSGIEFCLPDGSYSMCPVIDANDVLTMEE